MARTLAEGALVLAETVVEGTPQRISHCVGVMTDAPQGGVIMHAWCAAGMAWRRVDAAQPPQILRHVVIDDDSLRARVLSGARRCEDAADHNLVSALDKVLERGVRLMAGEIKPKPTAKPAPVLAPAVAE